MSRPARLEQTSKVGEEGGQVAASHVWHGRLVLSLRVVEVLSKGDQDLTQVLRVPPALCAKWIGWTKEPREEVPTPVQLREGGGQTRVGAVDIVRSGLLLE